MLISPASYTFVIDTEEYAGSFEREMCAYITAQVGECGVGDDMASDARDQLSDSAVNWFANNVEKHPDEHGCYRPAAIHPTPGWCNDGRGNHSRGDAEKHYPAFLSVAIYLSSKPSEELVALMAERAKKFALERPDEPEGNAQPLTVTGFRLIQERVTETELQAWAV